MGALLKNCSDYWYGDDNKSAVIFRHMKLGTEIQRNHESL